MKRPATLLAAILALAICPAALYAQLGAPPATQPAAADGQTAVPVKVVVLFSSGVGYFQHGGTVTGNASTELRFKAGQINDILKSLVLQDLGGGTVAAVTYPSQDPIDRTLKSFEIDITSNPSLADLLTQLRGAKVTAMLQGQSISGVVLGVEKRQVPGGDKTPIEQNVLTLLSGANIKIVPLTEVHDIALDDPKLQAELEKALAALAASRDQDKKPVTVAFRGQGKREVLLGYVVETPVWKTSYRLLLNDGKAAPAPENPANPTTRPETGGMGPLPGKATLQGWAIVENQTDNDWEDVQLSLVSGRPISFVQDLYRPLYIPRPVVKPELFASLQPQTYEGGMDELKKAQQMANATDAPTAGPNGIGGGMLGGGGGGGGVFNSAAADRSLQQADGQDFRAIDAGASIASVASATKLGELFQYTIRDRVSLPRQKSAMIPIVEDAVEIERVSIYNPGVLPRNPLTGVRMKNTTGKHLLAGPVTVMDAGGYAGDARIDNVPPGQERLLSYGVDLEVLVSAVNNGTRESFVSGKIVKGILSLSYKDVQTRVYEAQSKSDHDKTLIIEHPIATGWTLVDSPTPAEKTDTLYRFKSALPAGAVKVLTVHEERTRFEESRILDSDIGTVLVYSRNDKIPAKVKDALARAAELKQAVADTNRKIQLDSAKLGDLAADQRRLNETLRTIGQSTELYGRMMKKLGDDETELDRVKAEMEDLTRQAQAQQKDLEDYLQGLTVE